MIKYEGKDGVVREYPQVKASLPIVSPAHTVTKSVPKVSKWKAEVLEFVLNRKFEGATSAEVVKHVGRYHGPVSGTLSRLHKHGDLDLLTQVRGGMQIYVGPEYVNGRQRRHRP